MHRIIQSTVFLFFFGVSLSSYASDWQTTFASSDPASHIPTTGVRLIVVPAGESIQEAKSAAAALEDAFEKSERVAFVASRGALSEDLSSLDDKVIVQKCNALPIDYIVVVRVFPGTDNASLSGMVIIYDKNQTVIKGLNVAMGQPLSAPLPMVAESQPREKVENSVGATPKKETDLFSRLVEYDNNRIWFQGWSLVNLNSGTTLDTWEEPYYGKYKEHLEGARFFEVVGRPDLAERYQRRKRARIAMFATSGICAGVGLVLLVVGGNKMTNDTDSNTNKIFMASAGATTLTGFVLFSTTIFIKKNPIETGEMYRLVSNHNEKQQNRLNLTDTEIKQYLEQKKVSELTVSPILSPSVVGIGAGFTFGM